MKQISELLSRCGHKLAVVLMSLMMIATFTVANPNQADAGFEVDVAAGWDDLLLKNDGDGVSDGFVFTLSAGYRFIDLIGLFYEQDLGYIHPEYKKEVMGITLKGDGKKYFKGASLLSARLFISFLILELSIRAGFGAIYMDAGDNYQKWFAFRPGVGLAVKLGSLRIGAEFDYTLAAADRNKWDDEKNSHFISVKGFAGWVF